MRTVFILDDHRLFSNGLALMLASAELELECRVFNDPADAASTIEVTPPDLLIIDFYLPGANTPDLIRQFRATRPQCRIMVVSASINPVDRQQALQAGAELYINKASDPAELLDAIKLALDGGMPTTCSEIGASLSARFNLTPRQLEILTLVSKGCSNKEIARLLDLSPETVKSHLRDIFRRFGVANRIEAIDFARSNGLG